MRGSIDPISSQAAYLFGNDFANVFADPPDIPNAEARALIDNRLRVGLTFFPKMPVLIRAELTDFSNQMCLPCP